MISCSWKFCGCLFRSRVQVARLFSEPLLLEKESGNLYPDLLVQLNTSELIRQHSDALEAPAPAPTPVQESSETGDLIKSIVSGLDTPFVAIHYSRDEPKYESGAFAAWEPEKVSGIFHANFEQASEAGEP